MAICGDHQIKYTAIERNMIPLSDILNMSANRLLLPLERGTLNFATRLMSKADHLSSQSRSDRARFLWRNSPVWVLIRNLESTIPHDKIFGLHAISTRFGLDLPKPDYSKAAAEVYEDNTRAITQQTTSLSILSLCVREACATEHLPSWVPDWAMKAAAEQYLYGNAFALVRGHKATGYYCVGHNEPSTRGRLNLRGLIIGKVSFLAVSSTIGSLEDHSQTPKFKDFSRSCQSWCQRVALFDTYCTGCPTYEAAKRTMLVDRHAPDSKEKRREYDPDFPKCFDLFLYPNCRLHDPEIIKVNLAEHAKLDSNAHDLSVVLISYMIYIMHSVKGFTVVGSLVKWANYALMVLDTGYFARGAYVCKEGDAVALLAGYDSPAALRPDGHGNYKFVAPLYVDGVMYGEAWPENEETLEDIVLV